MFDCVFICHRLVFKACGFLIIFHLTNAGVSLFGAASSMAWIRLAGTFVQSIFPDGHMSVQDIVIQ